MEAVGRADDATAFWEQFLVVRDTLRRERYTGSPVQEAPVPKLRFIRIERAWGGDIAVYFHPRLKNGKHGYEILRVLPYGQPASHYRFVPGESPE